ncbi:hypothetical protein ACTFIW_005522 [Dictyostelium discoideum]
MENNNNNDIDNNNINDNSVMSPLSVSGFESEELKQKNKQLKKIEEEKKETEDNILNKKKKIQQHLHHLQHSVGGMAVIDMGDNMEEYIMALVSKIKKLKEKKKLLKVKVADLEAKIVLLLANIEKLEYRIDRQNTKIKTLGEEMKTQRIDIEKLNKQVEALMQHNNDLKESIDSNRINALQDAALIGEQVNLVTVCQYYLEHYVLKEINDDKEEKDKISWDSFKYNYTKNNEAKKIARGVELGKVLELCRDRNAFVHVDNEDEIKIIINNIRTVYSALPKPDAKFKPYKNSLLRICRDITCDEGFNLD